MFNSAITVSCCENNSLLRFNSTVQCSGSRIGAFFVSQLRSFQRKKFQSFSLASKTELRRGSARERGYDSDWEAARNQYYKSVDGLCEECGRRGVVAAADVVNHMIPVSDDPSKRLDWNNFDALCNSHHNGLARRMEAYARKTNAVSMLPTWWKYPETRPAHFQILQKARTDRIADGIGSLSAAITEEPLQSERASFEAQPGYHSVFNYPGRLLFAFNKSSSVVELLDHDQEFFVLMPNHGINREYSVKSFLAVLFPQATSGKLILDYART